MAKESRLQDEVGIFAPIPRNVRPVSQEGYVGFIQPMGETLAREVHNKAEAIIAKEYPTHPWFQRNVCYREGGKDGIHGSSLELNVIYNSILREQYNLSLPGLRELRHLDSQGALSNGVYREGGFQIASEGPNQDLSRHLIAEARNRDWGFPIVVPSYNPLGHRDGDSGFEIYFLGDKEGIDLEKEVLHGEKAEKFLLANFKRQIGKQGILRLRRYNDGNLDAVVVVRDSFSDGREDFVSGEASVENVTAIKRMDLGRGYTAKDKGYEADIVKSQIDIAKLQEQIAQLTKERERLQSQQAAELKAFSESLKGYSK